MEGVQDVLRWVGPSSASKCTALNGLGIPGTGTQGKIPFAQPLRVSPLSRPHGGDQADLAEIAKYYPSPTLSCLPLSTGSSLPFLRSLLSLSLDQYTLTSSQHCSPGDAIDIHKLLKSERSLGMHWGTFCEANESRGTRVEFGRKRREKGVSGQWTGEERGHDRAEHGGQQGWSGRFVVSDIGETLVLP